MFVFKLKRKFTFEQIYMLLPLIIYIGNIFMKKSKKSRAFLEFRPYSAFNFGGRNRKPKAENFRFWPKVSASGIPLHFESIEVLED